MRSGSKLYRNFMSHAKRIVEISGKEGLIGSISV